MIDVQDPIRNLILNVCFFAIVLLALLALVPWKLLGVPRVGLWLHWLPIPVIGLATLYEAVMPSRFDIRVDLFLLLPAYGVVVLSSIGRWVTYKRRARS